LTDVIILKMKREEIIELLEHAFLDKRPANKNKPFHILLTLAITVKMKLKTSLIDVPFALSNAKKLSEIS